MSFELEEIKLAVESILMTVGKPLSLKKLINLLNAEAEIDGKLVQEALAELKEDYQTRSFDLIEVASGYRIQVKQDYARWVGRILEEKPAKYSRALLETIALIAYRQPITRADIEDIRGVSVSTSMIKTLQERDWVRVVGHKDVPGKPALYATTKNFLDYFNLRSLDELPPLSEIKDLDKPQQAKTEATSINFNELVNKAAVSLAESIDFIVATTPQLQLAEVTSEAEQPKLDFTPAEEDEMLDLTQYAADDAEPKLDADSAFDAAFKDAFESEDSIDDSVSPTSEDK